MDKLKKVLDELEISASAQKIYLSLLREGEATARTLSKRTGVTRPSVYDQIKELRARDLVGERDIDGKTYFAPLDVRRLEQLLSDKIESLEEGRKDLRENMNALLAATQTPQPKIRFFEGEEGLRQLMKDILWHDSATLSIYWPYQQMVKILGAEYLQWFNKRRIKYDIAVKTIWPYKDKNKKDHIFKGNDDLVERRYARSDQIAQMGYLIYGDKVAFISSTKEAFGFIVESKEYAELMTMQFAALWNSATKERSSRRGKK